MSGETPIITTLFPKSAEQQEVGPDQFDWSQLPNPAPRQEVDPLGLYQLLSLSPEDLLSKHEINCGNSAGTDSPDNGATVIPFPTLVQIAP